MMLLSLLASASAFAVTGARPVAPARATTAKMMDVNVLQEVGANSLAYIQTSMDGSGGTQVFAVAAIGAASIILRNGKGGLALGDSWDTPAGPLSPAAIPLFLGPIVLLALKLA